LLFGGFALLPISWPPTGQCSPLVRMGTAVRTRARRRRAALPNPGLATGLLCPGGPDPWSHPDRGFVGASATSSCCPCFLGGHLAGPRALSRKSLYGDKLARRRPVDPPRLAVRCSALLLCHRRGDTRVRQPVGGVTTSIETRVLRVVAWPTTCRPAEAAGVSKMRVPPSRLTRRLAQPPPLTAKQIERQGRSCRF
jgi:hypothetical protein